MEQTDITIIGAGVIGLAIAAEIARPGLNVFILEKNHTHGGGISSRNSEVIHGGIYYLKGSLKGSLCVEGNGMLYEIAEKNHIPHKKTGKLIVAVQKEEEESIERLLSDGRENGATSLELITQRQASDMEPYVQARAALYSRNTGIISVHDLMNYYLVRALSRGAQIACNTGVTRIEKEAGRYRIDTQNNKGERFAFSTALVINAAGLESDTIANMSGNGYQLHWCKGDYCSVTGVKSGMVQRLIYPVPVKKQAGVGVHLTMDLNGRYRLGPDATYIRRVEDYQVHPEKAGLFFELAGQFLPFLKKENIHPDMAGIRPKLQGPGDDFCDFVIRQDAPGFINLVGIESPGMTASPAIARYVQKLIE
jgi:L-2-hydroxyglutarate oxidase LhgO